MASQIDYSYIGEVNSRAIFANITIGLVAAGIQLFMSIYGLSVFLETPKAMRKGRTRYIVVSFLLSGLSILVASLDAAWIFGLLFASTSGYDFSYKFAPSTLTWERYLSNAATTAIILIGDVLLVYRCFVIYRESWWVAIPPSLTTIAALVMSICGMILDMQETQLLVYESARSFLTVATNIMVTGLISFHLLRARRGLSELLPMKNLQLYTGVVAILIESAVPPTIFGTIVAVLGRVGVPSTTVAAGRYLVAWYTFSALFFAFCVSTSTFLGSGRRKRSSVNFVLLRIT